MLLKKIAVNLRSDINKCMAMTEPGWDLYRSFLAVLRLGSLSAAGRSLGLTQPTVGRHIALLQEFFGGRVLFTRSPAGLLPTAAAFELRPHAEAMAAAAAAFVRMGSTNLEETAGVVRLAAADVMGVEVLPAILSEFRFKHPTTVIELSLSNEMADLLRRDERDSRRTAAPLKAAPDAHLLDTTHLDIDAAFRAAVDIVEAVRAGRKRG